MSFALDLLFLLLGVLLPGVLFFTARRRSDGQARSWPADLKVRMYYANGMLLLSLAVAVLVVWHFAGRPLTELGLGWGAHPYDPVAVGILLAFLLLYGLDLYAEAGSAERQRETHLRFRELGFLPANGSQYLNFLFLCLCAGVGEEIVYRGFMITYLQEVLGTDPWAVAVTLLFPAFSFGVAHFYQGTQAVVKIVAMALLFGFFFYRTGSLWPLILLHTGIDAVGGLLAWYLEERK
ncbi:CPBP family intramembrane glutamic endopeptidase [Neolewinella litorea]|uniref:CPBP family intramembrane metalloprotease n=1 Tax=Neolewinella litorea TaxID=2562452 RepID=A0A4S4NRY9_9BACT|nr:CPBP family intramembrane glutamic endopeptidase [Neolewinella litorea]THH41995.1 CPBP family intramembrane metalloprotease [Neolewinella litorea]